MSGLTTHILDLTHGQPAAKVRIELFIFENYISKWNLVKTSVTNSDGRLDQPLLLEKEMKAGTYEIVFHIGEYFRSKNLLLPNPAFLEQVPVRFYISNEESHYHVPLLISPFGYQIYRGS